MSRYFLTKVWGFSPATYPALGFNQDAGRKKFLREGTIDDWVIMAGIKQRPTAPDDRGRLLGMVRLGRREVDIEKVLNSLDTHILPEHYDDQGNYKWPFGLPMLEARAFDDKPDIAS